MWKTCKSCTHSCWIALWQAVDTSRNPQQGWRARLETLLESYYRALSRSPGLAQLAMSTIAAGPNALRIIEALLGLLGEAGVEQATAAWAVDLITPLRNGPLPLSKVSAGGSLTLWEPSLRWLAPCRQRNIHESTRCDTTCFQEAPWIVSPGRSKFSSKASCRRRDRMLRQVKQSHHGSA